MEVIGQLACRGWRVAASKMRSQARALRANWTLLLVAKQWITSMAVAARSPGTDCWTAWLCLRLASRTGPDRRQRSDGDAGKTSADGRLATMGMHEVPLAEGYRSNYRRRRGPTDSAHFLLTRISILRGKFDEPAGRDNCAFRNVTENHCSPAMSSQAGRAFAQLARRPSGATGRRRLDARLQLTQHQRSGG